MVNYWIENRPAIAYIHRLCRWSPSNDRTEAASHRYLDQDSNRFTTTTTPTNRVAQLYTVRSVSDPKKLFKISARTTAVSLDRMMLPTSWSMHVLHPSQIFSIAGGSPAESD